MESVDTKMDLTFPFRRKLVAVDKISVKDLAEQFPLLTSRHEINKKYLHYINNKVIFGHIGFIFHQDDIHFNASGQVFSESFKNTFKSNGMP